MCENMRGQWSFKMTSHEHFSMNRFYGAIKQISVLLAQRLACCCSNGQHERIMSVTVLKLSATVFGFTKERDERGCRLIFSSAQFSVSFPRLCFTLSMLPSCFIRRQMVAAQSTRVSACFYIISKPKQQISQLIQSCKLPNISTQIYDLAQLTELAIQYLLPRYIQHPNPSFSFHSWPNSIGKYDWNLFCYFHLHRIAKTFMKM